MNVEEEIYRPHAGETDAWYNYTCGHCESLTAGFVVAYSPRPSKTTREWKTAWLLCSNPDCRRGSIYEGGIVMPQRKQGVSVEGLPEDVKLAYEEARKCFSVGAFTSCELICRKILMYVACHKGDTEGKKFVEYIDYLKTEGYITKPMEGWVGIIRQHGNDSTHKLKAPEKEHAESTLMFTGHLLKSIYEMENLSSKYNKPSTSTTS